MTKRVLLQVFLYKIIRSINTYINTHNENHRNNKIIKLFTYFNIAL